MDKQSVVKVYRIFFALLTVVAMAYLIYDADDRGVFNAGNFFSYFTIQSNIFVAVTFLFFALRVLPSSPTHDYIRGAVTLYMTLTGIVYGVLLSGYTSELQTTVVWCDNIVHKIIPLAVFADWLIDPPKSRLE